MPLGFVGVTLWKPAAVSFPASLDAWFVWPVPLTTLIADSMLTCCDSSGVDDSDAEGDCDGEALSTGEDDVDAAEDSDADVDAELSSPVACVVCATWALELWEAAESCRRNMFAASPEKMLQNSTPAAAAAGVLFWSIFSGEAANMFRRHDSAASQSSSAQVAQTTQATGDESSASTSASESSAASTSSSPVESASPSQSPSASESSTPEESQQVNMESAISVVNGTGQTNHASNEAGKLTAAGFHNVTPTNPNGMALPGQTVVWYQNDADLATAQQVANTLGIATVEQAPGIGEPIVVVLMQ